MTGTNPWLRAFLVVLIINGVFSPMANAQRGGADPSQVLRRFDQDRDGGLSQSEFAKFSEAISRFRGGGLDAGLVFGRLDANGDGKVTADEMKNVRGGGAEDQDQRARMGAGGRMGQRQQPTGQANGQPEVDPQALRSLSLESLDADGDGELSMKEFRKLGDTIPRLKADNVSGFVFSNLDSNNDGTLDSAEFRRIFSYGGDRSMQDQPFNPIAGKVARNPLRSIVPNSDESDTEKQELSADQIAFFNDRILPILESKCYACHSEGADAIKGGLRLDSRDHLRMGGSSGDLLDTDLESNLLVMAIRGEGMPLMPPKQALSEKEIADLESWVLMGSPDPRPSRPRRELEAAPEPSIDIEAGREHWAFQPMRRSEPSAQQADVWSRTDIDRYLFAAMIANGLQPAGDADRASLLRRLSLDLTGLPPTPNEVIAFTEDPRDTNTVFSEAVDRLLDSKHFGEHWGRHWLDVARYAESSGKDVNIFYPFAWRYRDYVIESFNADKPYDEFLTEQIAGDLLPSSNANDKAENLVATGYLAIGTKSHSEVDQRQFLLDVADEQIDAVSRGMLGLTISCARCHDHKFDPIAQKDYYSMAGIFASTETLFGGARTVQTNRTTGLIELPRAAKVSTSEPLSAAERQSLERQLEMMNRGGAGRMNPITMIRSTNVKAKLSHYDENGRPLNLAMSVRDGQPLDIPIFLRGELDRPSQLIPRGFPEVIDGPSIDTIRNGSGRLELAQWITDKQHPLTARVMANRVWQHLFGNGLVTTPDNFGTTGKPPSHPELLDHLALSLIDHDWSIKSLIRQIVTSRAYQMDTRADDHNLSIDPDNVYLWRQTRRRLPAESIRDSILVASGAFDRVPPVGSPVTRFGDGQTRVLDRDLSGTQSPMSQPQSGMLAALRNRMQSDGGFGSAPSLETKPNTRSVYLPVIRDRTDQVLDAFDFPDASLVTGKRDATTVASQSLFLMNSAFVIEHADTMAKNILRSSTSKHTRIKDAFLRTLSRQPRSDELAAANQFLSQFLGSDELQAWSALCQSLLSTAEFRHTR